ncbi:hypothetical protein [uncultured Amaricoccus sp.]|uniref:hypothetical protein n=1 Tax=uncultured Amaricoccus sp. TaxID=339341 RepID=UPI0026381170|nr:hypothetical protein [uncultured Amaricoccus sp.]
MSEKHTLTICYVEETQRYSVHNEDGIGIVAYPIVEQLHARLRFRGYIIPLNDLDAACRLARETGRAEITLTWRSPDE